MKRLVNIAVPCEVTWGSSEARDEVIVVAGH
jgi:hypothetical protein